MGFGDEIMATGMARGAKARGKRIAFGDGRKIIWGPWSEPIFRNNPNVARPGDERAADIEWIGHYKGRRLYNHVSGGRWVWNTSFRPTPGEMFFSNEELEYAKRFPTGSVVVEPNVPWHKTVAPNKDWGAAQYEQVARRLRRDGFRVVQFTHPQARVRLASAHMIQSPTFRHALAMLARAGLYVGPEGGMHHGAAAVGVPGVVLFGGFIPPLVTGYEIHRNLTGGSVACGSLGPCSHCRAAMAAISPDAVLLAAGELLSA